MTQFRGQVVAITGAGGGIGRRTAGLLSLRGAKVALLDLDEARLESAKQELEASGAHRVLAEACDVTSSESVRQAFEDVLAAWGRVDVLVNNAGLSTLGTVVELPEEDWDRVLAVNAKGTFLCSKAVLPGMLEAGSGAIVNVASQEGKRGSPQIAHYCAAKAAVINFTRALALEVAPHVRVNAVCPGLIETAMVQREWRELAETLGREVDDIRNEEISQIPLGSLQDVEDIAHAIAFLASPEAKQITGAALDVNGGTVMA